MRTVTTIGEARAALDQARRDGAVVGLVPTMGFLHDGHVSLMAAAKAECDYVMTTIFVNPLQFSADEDLDDYPRDLQRDSARTEEVGVDLLLVPTVDEMYPETVETQVTVGPLAALLEGRSRPTHFAGVATVVAKLFNIAGQCRAYFGEKDWQQLQVVKKMAVDLSFPVEVVGCPIVREGDGVAMSSRNVYLDVHDREAARVLSRSLYAAIDAVAKGERNAAEIRRIISSTVEAEPRAGLDYAAVVDGSTLRPVEAVSETTRLLVAAQLGPARLIDNIAADAATRLPG
ncbi:MAG: pantoate--beta-alanine ligase [Acidimicrobiales bacterium]